MSGAANIPSDSQVILTLESEMSGLKILGIDRQIRWRPQWFLDCILNDAPIKLVLRGDRIQEKEQPLRDEMRFHKMLEDRGIKVPKLYHWSEKLNAFVMAFIPGQQNLNGLPDDTRDTIVDEYVQELAKLHKLDPKPFLDAGVRTRTGYKNQIIEYRKNKTTPQPILEFGLYWSQRNPWRECKNPVPIVSDSGQFHHHNGHLQTLIDLEFGGLGDPLEDLTVWRMRDTLINYGDFRKIYKRYEELTGDEVDIDTIKKMHVAMCFGNEMMFSHAVVNPLPETDLMTYMQWDSETTLHATEALAELMEMELPTIEIPTPKDISTINTHKYLVAILNQTRPEDKYQQEIIRRVFRAARHLQRVAEIGDQLEKDNIDDIFKITNKKYNNWREANEGLEQFVWADKETGKYDRDLVWLFHRMCLRTHLTLGPIGSKMVKHYPCQRFDGKPPINSADFENYL